MAAMLALTVGVIAWRRQLLAPDRPMGSFLSKDGLFVLTNLLLMGFLVVVLAGTILPTLSELAGGRKIAIQAPFFNAAVVPFAIACLVLLGICPVVGWYRTTAAAFLKHALVFLAAAGAGFAALLVWLQGHLPAAVLAGLGMGAAASIISDVARSTWIRRRTTGEGFGTALANLLRKNTRRYGAYLVHLGVVVFCLGVVGSAYFSQSFDATVEPGQSFEAGPYTVRYERFDRDADPEKEILRAELHALRAAGPRRRSDPKTFSPAVRAADDRSGHSLHAGSRPVRDLLAAEPVRPGQLQGAHQPVGAMDLGGGHPDHPGRAAGAPAAVTPRPAPGVAG